MSELTKHVGLLESDSYRIAKEKFGDSALMEEVEGEFSSKLSDNPKYGDAVPYTNELFALRTQAFYPRVPSFRVLYRYPANGNDFGNVELLSIDLADDTPYEENNI